MKKLQHKHLAQAHFVFAYYGQVYEVLYIKLQGVRSKYRYEIKFKLNAQWLIVPEELNYKRQFSSVCALMAEANLQRYLSLTDRKQKTPA